MVHEEPSRPAVTECYCREITPRSVKGHQPDGRSTGARNLHPFDGRYSGRVLTRSDRAVSEWVS